MTEFIKLHLELLCLDYFVRPTESKVWERVLWGRGRRNIQLALKTHKRKHNGICPESQDRLGKSMFGEESEKERQSERERVREMWISTHLVRNPKSTQTLLMHPLGDIVNHTTGPSLSWPFLHECFIQEVSGGQRKQETNYRRIKGGERVQQPTKRGKKKFIVCDIWLTSLECLMAPTGGQSSKAFNCLTEVSETCRHTCMDCM